MSVVNLCILLLCIQPFVIWQGMFRDKEVENKSDLEFELSFLVIAPCFIFFYFDTFWYALSLLSCVSILGGMLAKLFESKAKRSLPLKELYYFMIVWFGLFSVGYGVVNLWEFIVEFFEAPVINKYAVEPITTDVPMLETSLIEVPTKSLLFSLLPSFSYLAAIICLFPIKLYEIRSSTVDGLSGNILLVLCIVVGILPLFSEHYILSLIINCLVLVNIGGRVITYKETDPSAGAIGFFYAFIFMGSVSASLMYKGVMWLFF